MDASIIYLVLGLFAGFAAGLLGVGGGLVIVPVLILVFLNEGFAFDVLVHCAIGTSLFTIIFTSLSSVYAHHFTHRAVDWNIFKRLTPGILLGAFIGALLADQLKPTFLKTFFGIFEILVAVQMFTSAKPTAQRKLPASAGMLSAGSFIGMISSVVGIGGGTLTVPFLVWCNVKIQRAVATSSACGLPIAAAGTAGFIMMGWGNALLPAYTSGYVYWPAVLFIVVGSVIAAPMGARLAHYLAPHTLKKLFSIILVILGLRMLLN